MSEQSQPGPAEIAELIDDLKNPLWQRRKEAAEALSALGNKAVPQLTSALREPNEDLRYWATIILGRIGDTAVAPLVDLLKTGPKDLRIFATKALGETRDRRAVQALIEALGDQYWSVRRNASEALRLFGESVVQDLTRAMREENEDIIFWTSKILGEIGFSAVDALLEVLRTGTRDRRFFAAIALGTSAEPRAIEALIRSLCDESWTVRKNAAEALERIGEPAIEPLTTALTDENKDVRYWSTRVLGKIGSKSIQPVLRLLKDSDTEVRHLSKKILANIGHSAIEPLVEILRTSTDRDMRKNAAEALGEIGSLEAIEPLILTLADASWFVRKTAADAIIALGRDVIPYLTDALSTDNEDIQYWVTATLGTIGKEAVYPLIDVLRNGEREMRYFAAEALGRIADPIAVNQLVEALRDQSWPVRKNAAEALQQIGESTIATLIRALKNENNDIRYWTKKVLRNFGDPVIVPLSGYLRDGDDDLRIYAAFALGEIRNTAAVPHLIEGLKDKNEWVRRYVVTALAEIADPRAAGPIIDSMLQESDDMKLLNSRVLYRFGIHAVPEIVSRLDKRFASIIPYTAGVLKSLGKSGLQAAVKELARHETAYAMKIVTDTFRAIRSDAHDVLRRILESGTTREQDIAQKLLDGLR